MKTERLKGKARSLKKPTVAASVVLGFVLSLFARVYPEVISERSGWCEFADKHSEIDEWHHRRGRCSLLDLDREGFEHRPIVMDAEIVHRRSPLWLLLYIAYAPLFISASWILVKGLVTLYGYLRRSIRPHSRSWLWRVLATLGVLSVLTHLIYLNHLAAGGLANLGAAGRTLHLAGEVLEYALLPLTLVSAALFYAFPMLNNFILRNTSPHLGFPGIQTHHRFLGAYEFNGWLWEAACMAAVLVFWFFLASIVCDMVRKLRERRHGAKEGTAEGR